MNKNEKSLTALLGVSIIILILLWFNSRRINVVTHANTGLTIPQLQPASYTIWQSNVPQLDFNLGNWLPTISEIYYASGSCSCQG